MRSAAPTAAQLRALHELRNPRKKDELQLGAMACPRPMSIDEWEAWAVPMQQKLMQFSSRDRQEAPT